MSPSRRTSTRTLVEGADGSLVRHSELPGGLRIVTERVPGVRSAAIGVWVGVGSRDEAPSEMGAAHFLEHLLFKGTRRRSAWQISAEIEAVGGEMNAFTTKEYTCYYARVLDDDLPLAIDVVCDLVLNGLLDAGDIEGERGVILEEIAMNEDDAADVVHDLFMEAHFGTAPLGRPILGTQDTIRGLSPRAIRRFYRRRYIPTGMVVAVAGNVDHVRVVDAIRRALGRVQDDATDIAAGPLERRHRTPVRGRGATRVLHRPLEQANVVLGLPGVTRADDRRYALAVLNALLGGGMSSRLFQEVRERRGLAYSVYSFVSHFSDDGILGVYAGCLPRKVHDVLGVTTDVLERLSAGEVTDEEVARGRGQVRGGVVLGQEDTGSRMTRIGKAALLHDHVTSVDDILARIDAVGVDDIRDLAATLLTAPPTLAVIGPFDEGATFGLAG